MESVEISRRKALQSSVAALCVESGYISADRGAVETLTQILQGYITEIGRTAKVYCEMAQRLEPTVSDVNLALIDIGSKFNSLDSYSQRFPRRHLLRQLRNYPSPQPKNLQVGTKIPRPPHIPSYLPPLPDSHTYIKTPIFIGPQTDYRTIKERLLLQRYHSSKALSKLLANTRPSKPIAGEVDSEGIYTVMLPVKTSEPVYLKALMPSTEDEIDPPLNTTVHPTSELSDQSDHMESNQSLQQSNEETEEHEDEPMYINPFIKPPTRPSH